MRPSAGTKRASAGSLPLSAALKGENLQRRMNGARQGRKRREGGGDGAAQGIIRDTAGLQGRAGGGVSYTRRGVRCHEEAETSTQEKHNLCDMSRIPEDKGMNPGKTLRKRRRDWMTSSTSIHHPSLLPLNQGCQGLGSPSLLSQVEGEEGRTL